MVKCSNCGVDAGDSAFCPNCGSEIVEESTINCPNCGFDVGDSAFCPSCGTKIGVESSSLSCPNCGFDVGDSAFCPNCGTKIEDESVSSSCPNCGFDVGDSAFCPSCGTKIGVESSSLLCPNCGFDVGDSAFCPSCGTKIVNEPLKLFCPSCGDELEEDAVFCSSCGTKLDGEKTNISQESSLNNDSYAENDFDDGVIGFDDKISGKLGGLFSKSKSMNKILDKTASYRYKNIKKSNNKLDRGYFDRKEPVFLEVYDSIDDEFVKDILLFQRSMMDSSGGVVGLVAAQMYTPTKDMSHNEAIRFYQNMVDKIVMEINAEKQKGTFDEEEFYKMKVKENTFNNVSVMGIPKSVKSYKKNQN